MKKYIKYLVIAALIVAAFIIWTNHRKSKNRPEWRTGNPSTGEIREVVTATGSINPLISVTVGTEVSGKIAKIYKDFNDKVRAGELLAVLDTEILSSSLETAKGELAKQESAMQEAEMDYNLQSELFRKNMTPEYDLKKAKFKYDQAKQTVANSRLAVERARKNLNNAYITSPISGIIVSREVEVGQTVAASMSSPTLFVIANNLDKMQITTSVDEADIGKISLGMAVEFSVDAHPMDSFNGEVNQIRLNPSTDQNVVSYSVIVNADNPDHKLLPGMTSNVTFIIQAKDQVLRIPEAATRFKPSKEIWKEFGLKWDDELLNKGSRSPGNSMAAGSKGTGSTPQMTGQKQGTKTPMPEGAKATGGFTAKQGMGKGRQASVWILKDNVPVPLSIRTGVSDGSFIEVTEGISGNETLITGVIYKSNNNNTQNSPGGPMGRF